MNISYDFVPMGYVATPEQGKVYVDVGNAFCPGVLDHHHPDASDACTAELVMNHPECVLSQFVDGYLTIIPHEYPDLDAVTGAYFAKMHTNGYPVEKMHHQWAKYVRRVDQGFTTLDVEQSVSPYSLFMMRMRSVQEEMQGGDIHSVSMRMLEAGIELLDIFFTWFKKGGSLQNSDELANMEMFAPEIASILNDLKKYQQDILRADIFNCTVLKKEGSGSEEVMGLWLENPESLMFKSWARGDVKSSGKEQGFVFLGVQISEHRFILSVDPSSGTCLKGLGDKLEQAEVKKRKLLGLERTGEKRPGYDSPDPWYDGRSPLHSYTVIDSPKVGTVLNSDEVKITLKGYLCMGERS